MKTRQVGRTGPVVSALGSEVVVVIGAGSIGQACARRVSAGRRVLLADLNAANAEAAAKVLADAGFDVRTSTVDVSSRESVHALVEEATALGDVWGVIHAAGVSPSQASPATILAPGFGSSPGCRPPEHFGLPYAARHDFRQ